MKVRKGVNLILLLLLIVCQGCVSAGRKIEEDKVAQIVKGQSTRADVERLLGTPTMTSGMDGGTTTLMYMHMRARSDPQNVVPVLALLVGGARTKSETLTVIVGADGTVQDVSSSQMQMHVNTGLINGSK